MSDEEFIDKVVNQLEHEIKADIDVAKMREANNAE